VVNTACLGLLVYPPNLHVGTSRDPAVEKNLTCLFVGLDNNLRGMGVLTTQIRGSGVNASPADGLCPTITVVRRAMQIIWGTTY